MRGSLVYKAISLFYVLFVFTFSGAIYAQNNNRIKSVYALPRDASDPIAILGAQLYFDINLSINRNQSCATCHNPSHAFIDNRDNGVAGMVSLGSDNVSLGDRNTPTLVYSVLSPTFERIRGEYVGGFFHDGRANTLADQAAGPPLNESEMGLTSKDQFLERLKEKLSYQISFENVFGENVFNDSKLAYAAMTQAIMAFQQTELFMPFDSKYDRYLRGDVKFTEEEELGKVLFFSEQFTNCNQCHQLNRSPINRAEPFTNFKYHNIGVPENTKLRNLNGVTHKDVGLFANPFVNTTTEKGKFKVPTLRNVAITGPYMHNGIFQELLTVVKFYDKYNNPSRKINSETGKPWAPPEIQDNLDLANLKIGSALNDQRLNALVAFLKTLTDKRYEHLLDK